MGELAVFLFISLVLLFPGVLVVSALLPAWSVGSRWTVGLTVGVAGVVYIATSSSHIHLDLFFPAWIVWCIVSGVLWYRRRAEAPLWGRIDRWLAIILLLVAGSRFGVALVHSFPGGWDPSFHMILARKIAMARHIIFDWTPFEPIALNYPLGSHCLLVVVSELGRLSLESTFKYMIPLLGVLTTAQIYYLALASTRHVPISRYSAIAYGLWALYGSIQYAGWGGLPNEMGMLLLLSMLYLLMMGGGQGKRILLFSLLCAAMVLVHHHVMLVGGAALAVLLVHYFFADRQAGFVRIILAGSAAAFVLAGFHTLPYLQKILTLGSTGALAEEEVFFNFGKIGESLGWFFMAASGLGMVWYAVRRRFRRESSDTKSQAGTGNPTTLRKKGRGAQPSYALNAFRGSVLPEAIHPVIIWPTITLAALFILFEYGYRYASRWFYHADLVAMAPSRFLTDMVCFLAIFAGYGWHSLVHKWLPPAVAGLLAICLGATVLPQWQDLVYAGMPPLDFASACRWIQENSSPDSVVLSSAPWASYLTWRRTTLTPLPHSEPMVDPQIRIVWLQRIVEGAEPPDSPQMAILAIAPIDKARSGDRILWKAPSGLAVIQVWPDSAGAAPGR
jgi:hypothetical protein